MATEPLSAGDLLVLAADRHASVPMQIGALVVLDPDRAPQAAAVVDALARRAAAVPRLRQRLSTRRVGRRGWVEDPEFDAARHLGVMETASSDAAQLDRLAELVCRPLPRDRPLWRATVLTDGHRARAVAIVLHHVLADGVGGLALLRALVDREGGSAVDARGARTPSATSAPSVLVGRPRRSVVDGVRELGLSRLRLAGRTSLLSPTGPVRHLDVVEADLGAVRAGASRLGATVNELVLVAISGAVGQLLLRRRDPLRTLVVSVPVSARSGDGTVDLGNAVGVVPVRIPLTAHAPSRLAAVTVERGRMHTSRRGSSEALLAPAFRALALVGAFQWFVRHQRLVHTFETNVRGPAGPLTLAGAPVARVVPVAVNPGNVTVSFDVLSAGGRLVISVVTDPVGLPEHEDLRQALQDQLASLLEEGLRVPASAHG